MLQQVFIHTPAWVWLLLPALFWLGFSQTRPRTASLRRVTLMPLAMVSLSLYSTVTAFSAHAGVLVAWLGAGAVVTLWVLRQPLSEATHYDPEAQAFSLPGSWVPMALILGIFLSKYTVGALSAGLPTLAHEPGFGLLFGALYGAFSGTFFARAARLWRLAAQAGEPMNLTLRPDAMP